MPIDGKKRREKEKMVKRQTSNHSRQKFPSKKEKKKKEEKKTENEEEVKPKFSEKRNIDASEQAPGKMKRGGDGRRSETPEGGKERRGRETKARGEVRHHMELLY